MHSVCSESCSIPYITSLTQGVIVSRYAQDINYDPLKIQHTQVSLYKDALSQYVLILNLKSQLFDKVLWQYQRRFRGFSGNEPHSA